VTSRDTLLDPGVAKREAGWPRRRRTWKRLPGRSAESRVRSESCQQERGKSGTQPTHTCSVRTVKRPPAIRGPTFGRGVAGSDNPHAELRGASTCFCSADGHLAASSQALQRAQGAGSFEDPGDLPGLQRVVWRVTPGHSARARPQCAGTAVPHRMRRRAPHKCPRSVNNDPSWWRIIPYAAPRFARETRRSTQTPPEIRQYVPCKQRHPSALCSQWTRCR
jgi:hypothetical protein